MGGVVDVGASAVSKLTFFERLCVLK